MTRSEIENKLCGLQDSSKDFIQANPVKAFCLGVLLGAGLGIFRAMIVPLVVFCSLLIWAVWFWADEEKQ